MSNNDDVIVKAFETILYKLENIDDKVITIDLAKEVLKTHSALNDLGTHVNDIHTNQNNISTNLTKQHNQIIKTQMETNFFLKHFKKVMFSLSVLIATSSYSLGVTQHDNIKPYFGKLFNYIIK